MLRRLSLRTRLVLGLLVLAAAGLVVADIATYKSQESFLVDQTDQTLQNAHQIADEPGDGDRGGGGGPRLPLGFYVETRSLLTGQVLSQSGPYAFPDSQAAPPPRLPTTFSLAPPTAGQP